MSSKEVPVLPRLYVRITYAANLEEAGTQARTSSVPAKVYLNQAVEFQV